jgi:hypothetical protein
MNRSRSRSTTQRAWRGDMSGRGEKGLQPPPLWAHPRDRAVETRAKEICP